MIYKEKVLYIILVNYNGHLDTVECLETLLRLPIKKFHIIVIDNSIGTESLEYLLRWAEGKTGKLQTNFNDYVYPLAAKPVDYSFISENNLIKIKSPLSKKIVFVKANNNNGFSAANNIALKSIMNFNNWSWVWLLNNDTVVESNSCSNLINDLNSSELENIGLIGTKLFNYSQPCILQSIYGRYNRYLGTISHLGEGETDCGQYDNYLYKSGREYPVGASFFISRRFLLDVGLMNEKLFLFYEEIDLVLRGQNKKWKMKILPKIKVFHKGGKSINNNKQEISSLLSDKCNAVNKLRITFYYFPFCLPSILLSILIMLLNRIKRGQFDRIKPILHAIITMRPK